jgi:hypothetical protein
MNPHLHIKIKWDYLKKYLTPYNSTAIKFPSGKCGRIHNNSKQISIQIENRKYIKNTMICNENNCETNEEIVIEKNKVQLPCIDINLNKKFINTCHKKKYLEIFLKSFQLTLNEFKETLYKKIYEIENLPKKYYSKEYLNDKINIFLGKNIEDDNWSLKSYFTSSNCNIKEWFGDYIQIWSLSISKDFYDIRTIIELDKQNKISLLNLFNEKIFMMGSPYAYLRDHLFKFYCTMNIIIYCNFYDKDNWCILNNNRIWEHILAEENFTFIPLWRYKYLKKYNSKTIKGIEYIKNKDNIIDLLKDIFRFLYTWSFLIEYTEKKYSIKMDTNPLDIDNMYNIVFT